MKKLLTVLFVLALLPMPAMADPATEAECIQLQAREEELMDVGAELQRFLDLYCEEGSKASQCKRYEKKLQEVLVLIAENQLRQERLGCR